MPAILNVFIASLWIANCCHLDQLNAEDALIVAAIKAGEGTNPSSVNGDDSPAGLSGSESTAQQSTDALIDQLAAPSFRERRESFLKLWKMGSRALPAVQEAMTSKNLQVAQAAAALEPILVLAESGSELSEEVFELLEKPSPSNISQLCRLGYWDLALQVFRNDAALYAEFQDAAGTWYLNQIGQSALEQGDPLLAWPLVQAVTSSPPAKYDGSDLSVWLATHLGLPITSSEAKPDLQALQLFYTGRVDLALEGPISDALKRKTITRSSRWNELASKDIQRLLLGGRNNFTRNAAQAVLMEFAGEHQQAERIWKTLFVQFENDDQQGADELSASERAAIDRLDDQERAAFRMLRDAPAGDKNQFIAALLSAGHATAIAEYFRSTDPLAAFDLYSSNSDYSVVFELMGLEKDVSNFEAWLDLQRAALQAEASRPLARGGSDLFEQAAHFCNVLVGLGFRNEAQQYLEVIAEAADTKSNLWEYSILMWFSRSEPRQLALEVLDQQINKLPSDTRSAILGRLFPDFENVIPTLEETVPPLVSPGDLNTVGTLIALERLHSWDHAFFDAYGVEISDWLVAAEREIISHQNLQQPRYVAQMAELAELAKGCGYQELAMQFAMADLGSSGGEYAIPQTQQIIAAEIWLERGEASKAATILDQLRSAKNARNSPPAFILELKALLLSGQYDRAREVNLSRWLRPLSVTRFYQGPYYSKAFSELLDQNDLEAAREYAELAFQLSDFGSMDFYWAAADLSRLFEENDEFGPSADALRAPIVEALTPGATQLNFQVLNHHIHFLRNAIKRERIHRAAACIEDGNYAEAKRHIQVGMRLQPQDIEMVVACYPRLVDAKETQMADWLFDTYESEMLKQLKDWPNDAMALNNLAWMYAKCQRKLDDAIKLAHQAVSLAPSSAVYLDTLAEVHFQSGRVDAAIAAMNDCIRMDPREKHYLENLERFSQAGP